MPLPWRRKPLLLARQAILIAGKHVFVEKPMSATVAEAEELVDLAERHGVVLMVDHTYLFTGAIQAHVALEETVHSGELGRLCYYDSMRINLGLFQPDVNVLWDLAPHPTCPFSTICWTRSQPRSEAASFYCHVNRHLPDIYVPSRCTTRRTWSPI